MELISLPGGWIYVELDGDMIPDKRIHATAVNTAARCVVAAGDDGYFLFLLLTHHQTPLPQLSYLFIFNAWMWIRAPVNSGTRRGWECVFMSLVTHTTFQTPTKTHAHTSLKVI